MRQKNNISVKTGEILIKSSVQLIIFYQSYHLSFDNCKMITKDAKIKEISAQCFGELSVLLGKLFCASNIITKLKVK